MADNEKIKLLAPNINVLIEGHSVILKPISKNEVNERYVSWLNDPGINQFLETRHSKQSVKSIVDYINGLRSKEDCELFAIFTKWGNVHVGNIGLTSYKNETMVYCIGTLIGDRRAQLLGLGGEAKALIIEYLFTYHSVKKIKTGSLIANKRSCRNIESLGFKEEEKTGENCVYILLKEDWQQKRIKLNGILKYMKVKGGGV